MRFEEAHQAWIQSHLSRRSGERRGRLERGHRHGEKLFLKKVWWPMMGSLDNLHPEYEVLDWRSRLYYADFVWMPGHVKLVIEVKGFGPHVRDMDRKQYCEELNRELFMQGVGYRVANIPHDEVVEHPEICIALLQLVLSRCQASPSPVAMPSLFGKEIILLAYRLGRSLRPKDVENHLGVSHRTAVRCCSNYATRGGCGPYAKVWRIE
jgi:hypothetical protein